MTRVASDHSDRFAARIAERDGFGGLGLFRRFNSGSFVFFRCPAADDFDRLHCVSGNETICTLTGFFSTTCLPMAVAARWCLAFTATLAAYACGWVSSSAIIAPEITPAQKSFRIDPPTDATDSRTV